ncbi:hypothetical protein STCU_10452 [Strigomonas culicis]|uniref:CCHC-type domain-containing protein n=1 Tax=Strigomonas culicis TaxID=28005 RepID=S9V4C9_9TRYP|nr:hypothetical protein STCU_10452 [Strigomonas culicis]|eukprot:EPY17720.1 hypothetical protein STCU_10452 [Strigomonas culicis]
MDAQKGCCQCGQRGHRVADCTRHKYHCRECGGVHDTKDCVYNHKAEEWHEFLDPLSRHVFYVNYADPKEVQWNPPSHEIDIVLWYCPSCQLMIPAEYNECLKCHAPRPVSREDGDTSSDEDSSSFSDESSSSGSDSASDSDTSSSSGRD